jgi:DNA segregation ATPase FtsK/SpoIIIE, S-DNA-T family
MSKPNALSDIFERDGKMFQIELTLKQRVFEPLIWRTKIVKETIFMVLGGLFAFLCFATLVADASFVGSLGVAIAEINIAVFGLLGYLYGFLLLYTLFALYKDQKITPARILFSLGIFLYFLLFLPLQASVFAATKYEGATGRAILDLFVPMVGRGGFWIFWISFFLLASFLVAESTFFEFLALLKRFFTKLLKTFKPEEKTVKPIVDEPPFDVAVKELKQEYIPILPEVLKELNIEPKEAKKDEAKEDLPSKPKAPKVEIHGVEIVKELEENKELLKEIKLGNVVKSSNWKLPPTDIFAKPPTKKSEVNEVEIDEKIAELIDKLKHFKIEGDVIRTYTGPVVTTFEFKPAANIKVSRILTLQDDIAMALKAQTIRIQAPIPGKDVVGIEIPNKDVQTIYMRELVESELFAKSQSKLTLILGKDIVGNAFVTDLKKLPHLLIAGTTGSGKSVGINAMILSLLYKNSPDELRLMMIDPKMLEFSIYNDIPHLLTPVITKPKQAVAALSNMVSEMERRYQLMSKTKTKNIENYNEKGDKEGYEKLPYIVVIIDELADLMMTSGKDVELSIARLAQMARASGIHLIVATQRPSVDVVTGLIKANLPSRVSFKVGQKIDSKVILDQMGAERLLGRGDMLFTPPGSSGVVRLHAPWSSEGEIEEVVEYLKKLRAPSYDESFLADSSAQGGGGMSENSDELDELYEDAKNIVLSERKTSISYIQRRLQIGYNRAARIVEQLENTGVISQADKKGGRDIL